MYIAKIRIENFRRFSDGDKCFELSLRPGLTALVGENDSGKTAVIDALRFALGTADQEWYRLEDTDFHGEDTSLEIKIVCKFDNLNARDKMAFVEYLTYDKENDNKPVLYVNWSAKNTGEAHRGRTFRRVEIHSGQCGDGPIISQEARELLRATYMRPLRDAEQSLSAGRGSRLSQVLQNTDKIKVVGVGYDPKVDMDPQKLNVLGIGDLANALLEKQKGIVETQVSIDNILAGLTFQGSKLKSNIMVSGVKSSDDIRLRQLLEKLDLILGGLGKPGLGSNNLLFMACEFLLLAGEKEGNRLLLIEEPEAHLHAQRQLLAMKFLQEQSTLNGIQVIVTTHSPNLASAIELDNMVLIRDGHAFSMAENKTELEHADYRFLKRFLDVTKANLFFAHGVMIVEGDAENILLPTLARILGCDFSEHGISIVNVGGVGLCRYARIFQRKEIEKDGMLNIPVACVTDMDVMPNCAPMILGKIKEGASWPAMNGRHWKAKKDFCNEATLATYRIEKESKTSGQYVKTFISNEWTLEYDLALGPKSEDKTFSIGLAQDIFVAAFLAENDDAINCKRKSIADIEKTAIDGFAALKLAAVAKDGCSAEEILASNVYAKYARAGFSKPIAAQYLAERLLLKFEKGELTPADLRARLPKYITEAIDYVTGATGPVINRNEVAHE